MSQSAIPLRPSDAATSSLPPRTLTTWKVLVLIVGTLTPLSFLAGTTPLALLFGGATFPVAIIAGAVVIGLFTIGYSRLAQRINRPGAYYSYVARGLGRYVGVGTGYVAIVTYVASLTAIYAVTAFTIAAALPAIGILPDMLPTETFPVVFLVQAAIVAWFVWQQIDLSALVSGVIVTIEVLLVLVFVVAAFSQSGLDWGVFSPTAFELGDWRVSFIFAILLFQGFESGALYAPEARRPEKTIPRALFLALIVIAVPQFLGSWALISHTGVEALQGSIDPANGVGFVLDAVGGYLGPVGLTIFTLALILATVVATLGMTNFVSRYLNGVAKDDLLPAFFARNNRRGAPATSAFTAIALCTVITFGTLLAGGAPYSQLTPIGFGIAAIGSTSLVLLSSLAVLGFFGRKAERANRAWWSTAVAPALASVLVLGALGIEYWGFSYITGSEEPWTMALPWIVVAAFVFGVLFAFWLRSNRPSSFRDLAAGDSAEEAGEIRTRRLIETGSTRVK